jgi:hypothetical protein
VQNTTRLVLIDQIALSVFEKETDLQRIRLLLEQLMTAHSSLQLALEDLLVHTRRRNLRHVVTCCVAALVAVNTLDDGLPSLV